MPRRTRSSIQTTAIRPPIKRAAPTEETPTLALTPIEVDSLVRGASADAAVPPDASTRPTVENLRLALGSSSLRNAPASGDGAAAPPEAAPATAPPGPATAPAAPTGRLSPSAIAAGRGARRTRETLRADAIRPPTRKR